MKGILIGGLLGGLVMFFWGFVAHMVLPFGEMGLIEATPAQQDAVLASVKDNFQSGPGVYIVPMDMQAMKDPAKAEVAGARALANPYAFVVYQPQGRDTINHMGSNLGIEWATNTACALLVAFLVSFAGVGFGMRTLLVLGTGVFGWLANAVPMWNWYRFPTDFTMAALIMQSIGWLLVGLVVAWALKRFAR
jgi:hypothetical protein